MAIEGDTTGVRWARVGVAVMLATVWSVLMLFDAFSEAFSAPPQLGAALGVVAYLFGKEIKRVAENGNGG